MSTQCFFGKKGGDTSAEDASIEAPKAQRGLWCWRVCLPPHWGRSLERKLCPLSRKKNSFLELIIASFAAF